MFNTKCSTALTLGLVGIFFLSFSSVPPSSADLLPNLLNNNLIEIPGLDKLKEFIEGLFKGITSKVDGLINTVASVKTSIEDLVKQTAESGSLLTQVLQLLQNVGTTITSIPNQITTGIGSVLKSIDNTTNLVTNVQNVVNGVLDHVKDALSKVVNVEEIVNKVSTSVHEFPNKLSKLGTDITTEIANIPKKLAEVAEKVHDSIENVGKQIDTMVDKLLQSIEVIPSTAVSIVEKDIEKLVSGEKFSEAVTKIAKKTIRYIWDHTLSEYQREIFVALGIIGLILFSPIILLAFVVRFIIRIIKKIHKIEKSVVENTTSSFDEKPYVQKRYVKSRK